VTRAFVFRTAVLVLVGAALCVGAAFALRLSRTQRERLDRLDKFCAAQVTRLRNDASFIRQEKRGPSSDYVQTVYVSLSDWTFNRICGHDAVMHEWQTTKCNDLECVASELEKLADAMDNN
jgi:hypothetical protein